MTKRVIIEDEKLKINGVAKFEEISSILSMVNEEVTFVRRYVEPLEPFLAMALAEKCPTKIQGLKHKYPLAFKDWDNLTYRNARLFMGGTLEQDQTARIAYALVSYATEKEELKLELEQLVKKEFPVLHDYFKELEAGHQLCVREIIHLTRLLIKVEECGNMRLIMNALSVIEQFIAIYQLEYDYENHQQELLDILAYIQRANQLFLTDYSPKGFNCMVGRVEDKFLKRAKQEIRPYIQAYEKRIGMDLVQYYRKLILTTDYKENPLLDHSRACIFRHFGQDIQRLILNYPLTKVDLEQLLYVLLLREQRIQVESELSQLPPMVELPEVEVFCDYVDEIFLEAVLDYICAKAFTMNHQYFFKNQGFSDPLMAQALQKEVDQRDRVIEQLKQRSDEFESQKVKLKEEYSKESDQQAKVHKKEMALVNQENRRLQKELEEMKEALELAKQQLEECEEVSALMSSDSLEPWEDQQARWIEQLNRPEILIVGCHPRTIHRLKPMLPNAKYYELDTNVQDYYLKGVEHIFVCLHQVNHSMMFKLDRCCPDVPRYPIRKTNAQLIIQELAQTLGFE